MLALWFYDLYSNPGGVALPAFLYDNRLLDAAPVASTTAAGFDVANLGDMKAFSFWKPTALPATVTVDCGSAAPADFAAIYRHDLATCGCTLEIRGSADNFSASNVLVATIGPDTDKPFVLEFDAVSYRYWRIRVTGSDEPTIAIALIGEALRMPRLLALGFDPMGRAARSMTNQSGGGHPLGRVVSFNEWRQKVQLDVVQWSWLRETWQPAWDEWISSDPFLFSWDSNDHPTEVYLVHAEGQYSTPTIAGDKCSFEVEIAGALP